jgi:membrane-bound metal-dependent hydrolase YbcI (DUF457 family)
MYVGHLAAGLTLKAAEPKAPTWALLVGVGLLDLLFGPFVLLGIERVSVTPGVSPGFSLDFIDWSHSLVMSAVWAGLFALLFLRRGRSVAAILGLAVFSHFLLDLPMHPPDLAIWPLSAGHAGFGLWRSMPIGWWFVELGVIAAGWAFYACGRASRSFAGRPMLVGLTLLVLHAMNSPWLSAT